MSCERAPALRFAVLALLVGATACTSAGNAPSAAQGAMLFHSKALSSSPIDIFTCATCHDTTPDPTLVEPGAVMAGVTQRTSFWGGMEGDLLSAVNDCRRYFMNDRMVLTRDDADAESLYAFLQTLEPGSAAPVPFTTVGMIVDVARGDAGRGATVYARACADCHGDVHTGTGRLSGAVPILPEDVLASHATYDVATQRLIFIEKVRHGGFYGYTGVMPPFSEEALADSDLGDLLETLGTTGVAP